jgi:hypothetical protein
MAAFFSCFLRCRSLSRSCSFCFCCRSRPCAKVGADRFLLFWSFSLLLFFACDAAGADGTAAWPLVSCAEVKGEDECVVEKEAVDVDVDVEVDLVEIRSIGGVACKR